MLDWRSMGLTRSRTVGGKQDLIELLCYRTYKDTINVTYIQVEFLCL